MSKLLFTILTLLSFISGFQNLSAQSAAEQIDAASEFKVNPNPDKIHNTVMIPIEEIFGLNQNIFGPSGLRGRGNIFLCDTPRKLIEHRLYLNPTAPANLWFVVYEGITDTGDYTLINSVNVLNQGPGAAWYGSGSIDVNFEAGKYYMIYTQWDVTANYWNQNPVPAPYPIPCSFGELQSGVGWQWVPIYGVPPPAIQNVQETFVDPVAYYQTIVTDDISTAPNPPTNLLAAPLSSTSIQITWEDNSANEDGFLIQRRLGFAGSWNDLTTVGSDIITFTDIGLVPSTAYCYRVLAYNGIGNSEYSNINCASTSASGIDDINSGGIPESFELFNNYPNPFNPSTTIYYAIPEPGFVELKVFDVLGNEMISLVSELKDAGYHNIQFDATGYQSGIYFYRLESGGFVETKKMALLK